MSEVPKIIQDFIEGNNDAGGTIASLEEYAKRLAAQIEEMQNKETQMNKGFGTSTASQSQIIDMCNKSLEAEMVTLMEIAAELENRLCQVMSEPEPSSPAPMRKELSDSSLAQSPLGSTLRLRTTEAASVAERLRSILRRLEI